MLTRNEIRWLLGTVCVVAISFAFFLTAIFNADPLHPLNPLPFSFEENNVRVTITYEKGTQDQSLLVARFEPLTEGYHLYSKDLQPEGINGIGRPTFLELAPDSPISAQGALMESVSAQESFSRKVTLSMLTYPEGPVILSLPVAIPAQAQTWIVPLLISYMTCNEEGQCTAPVIEKLVAVQLLSN